MNQIRKAILGLEILEVNGYDNIVSVDGCIMAGSLVERKDIETLIRIGWEFDEDNQVWYLLLNRDACQAESEIAVPCPVCRQADENRRYDNLHRMGRG